MTSQEIDRLAAKVEAIEARLPLESDVRILSERVLAVDNKLDDTNQTIKDSMKKWDNVADKLSDVATVLTRREETEKHLIKEVERQASDIKSLKLDAMSAKLYMAVDEPHKENRRTITRVIITVLVGGAMTAIAAAIALK